MSGDSLPANILVERRPVVIAGFWRRFWALGIDLAILSIAEHGIRSSIAVEAGGVEALVDIVAFLAPAAICLVWPYSRGGQTVGKRLLGIRVVAIDGSALNWRKGVLRSLGYFPSGIALCLGFLWSIWDADKQTWHDKIAATTVIRQGHFSWEQGAVIVDPREARRRQRKWLLPSVLVGLAAAAGFWFFVQTSVDEVQRMEPWPDRGLAPEQVVAVDLSHLGLRMGELQAGEPLQDESRAVVEFYAGEQAVVEISALRFPSIRSAGNVFTFAADSANANCGTSVSAYFGSTGIIRCGWRNGYRKTFWKEYWIVEISAREGTGVRSQAIVDEVRNALVAHWTRTGNR